MSHTGYYPCESAVISELIDIFDGLNANNCKSGDLDAVLAYILGSTQASEMGCYIEYFSGYHKALEPYKQMIWVWIMQGVILLRVSLPTVEADIRNIINTLSTFGQTDHTLGGVTSRTFISLIDQPKAVKINDVPYYWLPFVVEAWDKG